MGNSRSAEGRQGGLPVVDTTVHRPAGEILYVPEGDVLSVSAREQAQSFDAPGATYTHRGAKCTFEVLIDELSLAGDAALARLARVVHAADIDSDLHTDPIAPGLLAIGLGALEIEANDNRLLDRQIFIYDALYAWCQRDAST